MQIIVICTISFLDTKNVPAALFLCVWRETRTHSIQTSPLQSHRGSSGLTTNSAGPHASGQGLECASQNWLSKGTCSVLGQPWGTPSRVTWCVEGLSCPAPLHSQVKAARRGGVPIHLSIWTLMGASFPRSSGRFANCRNACVLPRLIPVCHHPL